MFAQRGMGKLIFEAIMGNDFNLALMGLLFATTATLVSNLVADIAYAWLDPGSRCHDRPQATHPLGGHAWRRGGP
jgi:ABC-type dipeptide/oligopeptide/nickel transport system permease component